VSDGKVVMENPNPAGHKTDDVPTLISSAQQMLAWVDSEGRTKALENLEAARIQEPHSAEVMAHIGLFYFYRAQIDERQEGDLERALQEIQNALASDPPMHLLLNILFCYIHTSNTEAARAVMDRIQAVELEPIREVQHLIFKFDPYWPKQGMSPPFYRQALLDYLDCRLLLLEGKNPEAKTKYEAFMTAVRSEHADLLEICTQEEIDEMFQSASQMGVDFPQLK